MNKGIRVAIIDNGTNEHFIKNGIDKSIAIDENGICIADKKHRAKLFYFFFLQKQSTFCKGY